MRLEASLSWFESFDDGDVSSLIRLQRLWRETRGGDLRLWGGYLCQNASNNGFAVGGMLNLRHELCRPDEGRSVSPCFGSWAIGGEVLSLVRLFARWQNLLFFFFLILRGF
jgi:hypothetical protein